MRILISVSFHNLQYFSAVENSKNILLDIDFEEISPRSDI